MEKNESSETDSIGGSSRHFGLCRTEEERIRVPKGAKINVPFSNTQGSAQANQESPRQISSHAYSNNQVDVRSSGDRLDGEVLGRGSSVGLLHSRRQPDPVHKREIHGSNRGLQAL